jgi:type VI secretion system secreted protein VgrG
MALLELALESREVLAVSRFQVREEISELFDIWIQAVSTKPDIDSAGILDRPMGFMLDWRRDEAAADRPRIWTGICGHFQQIHAEPTGLSVYLLRLVPELWRLQQRVTHRIFKRQTLAQIVRAVLEDWTLRSFDWNVTAGNQVSEYTVQYGESDYCLLSRLLESAGIAYVHRENAGVEWPCTGEHTVLSFSDALEKSALGRPVIPFVDNPNLAGGQDCVSNLRIADEVRPGRYIAADYAFQQPRFDLTAEATTAGAASKGLHPLYLHYHYEPGALHEGRGPELAMHQGIDVARHLLAERAGARELTFDTNATDLAPATVFTIGDHPLLSPEQRLLVTSLTLEGAPNEEWHLSGMAVSASEPFRPRRITPKPRIHGVQSAVVVPDDWPTDEYGRICIQFPWDRSGTSSCWVRVSQAAASEGFGIYTWPQPGDEVLVSFVEGDPDQPIVVGRVYNATHVHPYPLPDHHSRGTWRGARLNEITFEDKQSREFVYVHATKDLLIEAGGDRQSIVAKDSKESVGANRHLLVGADECKKVAGSASLVVGADYQLKASGKHAIDAGQEIHLKSGCKIVLESMAELTLKTQGGFIKLDATGVTIKGNLVQINCPGPPAGSGSGSSPSEPEAPAIEFDGKPG